MVDCKALFFVIIGAIVIGIFLWDTCPFRNKGTYGTDKKGNG